MQKDINDFKIIFNRIRSMGYIKAVNNYNSGIGLTFESFLGKKVDDFPLPDFHNTIEIKTKLAFSRTPIHLFTLTPDGEDFLEIKRIYEKYSFYYNNHKVFSGTIYANKLSKIDKYYFLLIVDYKNEKVRVFIYNRNKILIDNKTYWTFENIKNALYRKLKYLAFIQAWPTIKNQEKYYRYFKCNIYKLSNFYNFLNLLEKGLINISFSIDTYKDEKRKGQIHDHGTTFNISKENLDALFCEIK